MDNREDPMFSLLSSVGGIDSARFQKPQAMKDQRVGQVPSLDKSQAVAINSRPNTNTRDTGSRTTQVHASGNAEPPRSSSLPKAPAKEASRENTNSQLDSLLEGSFFNKRNRPMRETKVSESQTQQSKATPQEATVKPEMLHDDLDAVFASAGSASLPGISSPNSNTGDPFDLFGGIATPQRPQTSASTSHERDTNLIPGLSDQRGPPAPSPWEVDSLHTRASSHGSDPWGAMTGVAASADSHTSSPPRQLKVDTSFAQKANSPQESALPSRSSSQTGIRLPPSYDSVMRSPDSGKLASPRGSRVSSPRGSMKGFQVYKSEEEEIGQTDRKKQSGPRKPRRANSGEKIQIGTDQVELGKDGDVRDQAKQWLSAGREWLSGASKKVAQAVKDTQTQINNRLEELDTRHSQGMNASSSPRKGWQRRQTNELQQTRERPDGDVSNIPQYYFEWAATIEALPADDQSNTLAAMPDEDASNIRRILRSKAKRNSYELTEESMIAAAKQRSLRDKQQQQQHQPARQEEQGPPPPPASIRSRSSELVTPPTNAEVQHAQKSRPRPHSASGQILESELQARSPPPSSDSATADLMGLHLDDIRRPVSSPNISRRSVDNRSRNSMDSSHGMDDLMGLHSPAPPPQPKAVPSERGEVDILGMSAASPPTEPSQPSARSSMYSNDLLNPSGPTQGTAVNSKISPDIESLFGNAPHAMQQQGAQRQGRADSMIDFGDDGPSSAGLQNYYQRSAQNEEQEGEPEERKIARQKRLAAQQARIQKQLQEKVDRDRAEEQKREAQHDHRTVHRERIEAWKSGKKDNIRALLSTLHTVLWENSGWTPPGMTDLVEPSKVKRSYMKANLVVHPDKVKQKGGSVEQIVIADMAFDTLKTAWSKFESTELQRR